MISYITGYIVDSGGTYETSFYISGKLSFHMSRKKTNPLFNEGVEMTKDKLCLYNPEDREFDYTGQKF